MKTLALNFLILLFAINVFGQTPEWKYLGNGDKVNVVLETNELYYIGTESGLLELNKNTQEIIRTDRSNSLLYGNSVLGLAKQGNGSLLVASLSYGDSKGVTRHNVNGIERILDDAGPMATALDGSVYMITSFGFYHITGNQYTKDSLMGYEIPGNIVVNPVTGDVWFTTFTFGQYYVYKYDGLNTTKYDYNDGLPFENPYSQPIAVSKAGEVYVSTWSGIYKEENGSWINIKPTIDNEVISGIACDENGILYAVYQKESESVISIIKLVNGTWELAFDGPIVSYFGYTVRDIEFSNIEEGKLILTSYGFGVWEHNNNSWTQLKSQAEIAEVRLTQLSYIDNEIWAVMGPVNSYDSIGILRYAGKDYLNGALGLPKNSLDAYLKILGKDSEGNLWARTQFQLFRLENNVWQPDTILGIPDFNVAYLDAIAGSSDGRTVLYHNSDAYLKTNGIWKKWIGAPVSTYQTNLLWDVKNRLFVSYYEGWSFFDGTIWHNYNTNIFTAIKFAEAPNHDVYIFTGYQLLKVAANGNSPQTVSIPSGEWFSMTIDNKGYIWLASAEELTYYNGSNWISFDLSEPGYIGGAVLNIEADNHNNIWIATYNSGLEIFNPTGIVTSIKPFPEIANQITLYPNPTSGLINFEFSQQTEHKLELYDVLGMRLYTYNFIGDKAQMEVPNNLPNGIYWVTEKNGHISKSKSFILNR